MIAEHAESARLRILIVDDNRDAAQTLGALLELHGAVVRIEYGAEAALAAVDEHLPRLLLIDLGMPDRDGLDMARALAERSDRSHLTLVAVTGWGDQYHRDLSRAAGFDHHLVKPVHLDELFRLVTSDDVLRSA
jgi:DNA-binding response OmpR family regulator